MNNYDENLECISEELRSGLEQISKLPFKEGIQAIQFIVSLLPIEIRPRRAPISYPFLQKNK